MSIRCALKVLLACQPDAGNCKGETGWSIIALWEEACRDAPFPTKTYVSLGIAQEERDIRKAKQLLFDAALDKLVHAIG